MKESFTSKLKNKNDGHMQNFTVRLAAHVADWVEHTARSKGKTTEQLLQELITETVEEHAKPLEVRLQRVSKLIKEIVILFKKTPMKEEKDAKTGSPPFDERKRKRDHLLQLGMEAFDELKKISSSEQASKKAEFRMRAFNMMVRVGMFSAAVIRDQQAEDIARMMDELEKENYRLEDMMKEIKEENAKRDAQARRAALL